MKIICCILFCFLSINSSSAQEVKSSFYLGTVNKRPVRLFLKQELHPCGGENYLFSAIYQYGTGKNWIQLSVEENGKGNFCFVEYKLSGLLVLRKTQSGLEGVWLSHDAKTQLKVLLTEQPLSPKQAESLKADLDRTNYENNDC